MSTKFKHSWELFKASVTVTFQYPKLLLFPVLTAVLTVFISFFFFGALMLPVVLHHTGYHIYQKEHWAALKDYYSPPRTAQAKPQDQAVQAGVAAAHQKPTIAEDPTRALHIDPARVAAARQNVGLPARVFIDTIFAQKHPWYGLAFLPMYFASMFLATFFNVAFYNEIISALNGKGVSISRGLGVARSRLPSILVWSLFAGIVGSLIRAIEERLPFVGRIFMGLIGLTWSVAAVFAIPVIVQQKSIGNPIKILQQSATTLKGAWGEGLIGYVGFSAASMVILGCSLVPLAAAGALAFVFKTGWIIAIAGVLWVIGMALAAYVSGVAGNVYRCALYLYAAEGVVPEPYNKDLLDVAWKVKKS